MEKPNSEKTVAEIAADDAQFSTLVGALERVDLVEVLNGAGPFTVFAPTNAAFEALGVDLSTISDEALSEILLYHVFGGLRINAADIAEGQTYLGMAANTGPDNTNLSMLVENAGGKVTINGSINVTATDIGGNNGVIHVVDQVIMPLDVVGHAVANSNFSTLVGALGNASGGLVGVLSGDGPFTVFAPLNSAFDEISDVVAGLSADQLAAVLTYHVVGGNVLSTALSDGLQVTSVNGEPFTVNISDSGVTITDAQGGTSTVLLTDVQGTNGVIHVLDRVILPAEL
ncbi:MAG: fasciclin domain-containing protein [Bacteroidota bacterium]